MSRLRSPQLLFILSVQLIACAGGPSSGVDAASAELDGGVDAAVAAAAGIDAGAGGDAAGAEIDAEGDGGCAPGQVQALEQAISSTLDVAAEDPSILSEPDFTLLLETTDGSRSYAHSHGTSTATTSYESASSSKLVSATIILDLVDQGVLSLDTKPHDLLPFWSDTTVTLRDLLSFTSGYFDEPICINSPIANFETCVESIYTTNSASAPPAGSEFHYSGSHLQVAGLMAMKAAGVGSWTAIFAAWKLRTGLFPTAKYDLPSMSNPRLAGGMHLSAEEYLGFLRALARGQLLTPASRTALFANQRGSATASTSPPLGQLQEDWSYGLGNWLECPTAKAPITFNCGAGHRNSSAGAYGIYPFIDFDHHYFGVVSRQGPLGTGFESVNLFRTAEAAISKWADGACAP